MSMDHILDWQIEHVERREDDAKHDGYGDDRNKAQR